MANIKTTGGKVITKDGKVSCTCCGDECCLYPADGLGTLYSEDDLPDVIYYDGDTLTRVGSAFVGDDYEINNTVESGQWTIVSDLSGGTASYGRCLITSDGNMTPNDDWVEDQFEPTYSDGSNTLTRASSCVWSWTNMTSATQVSWNETESKWQYTRLGPGFIPPWVYEHDGPQSSPAGTYTRIEGGPGGATTVTIS
jgi:hypothetical protein